MLLKLTGFHGWEVSAAWEHFKFAINHFSCIEHIAIVGEQQWQKRMATFSEVATNPVPKGPVRYFNRAITLAERICLEQK